MKMNGTLKKKFLPTELYFINRYVARSTLRYLDVGCGNHKASQVKKYFPAFLYYGLDRCCYNNDENDYAKMEKLYEADLEHDDLSILPTETFDVIMFCQVIEHLENGEEVLGRLASKLASGGYIYVEFPGRHSVGFWTRLFPFFHFKTDPTHKRLYSFEEVSATLRDQGLHILAAGQKLDWRKFLLLPLTIPYNIYLAFSDPKKLGVGLWHVFPRSEFVFAQRHRAKEMK